MKKILFILLITFGLQAQAQTNFCNLAEINIVASTPSTLDLSTNLSTMFDSSVTTITYDWSVWCLIIIEHGTDTIATPHFQDLITLDTLVVCLTSTVCTDGLCYACDICDTLIYNSNSYQWEAMSTTGNPLAIKEIKNNYVLDNKMYDLLGREIFEISLNEMYIKNNKKCIRIK